VQLLFPRVLAQLHAYFLKGKFPMPPTQAVFFFSLPTRSQGWSESFYTSLSPSAALVKLTSLIDQRLAFMAPDCQLIGQRTSVLGPPRDSLLQEFSPPQLGTNPGGPAQNAETCFNYRLYTGSRNRLISFRGCPDIWEADGERTSPGVANASLIGDYLNAVVAAGFGLSTLDPSNLKSANATITTGPVSGIDATVTNADLSNSLHFGDLVRIRGCKQNPIINGTWRAFPVDALTYRLIGSKRYYVADTGSSTSQKVSIITDPFNTWSFVDCSTRRTGRVFGVPRGRRPALVRRR
jgi:hypothetical protein